MRCVVALGVVLASCVTAWAQAPSLEPSTDTDGRTFGDGALPEHLAIYDVDSNGLLSVEEIQAMKAGRLTRHQDWVARWDTNRDGVIDGAERNEAQKAIRQQIEARRAQRFVEADSDGDDCLTFEEFSAIPAVADLAARDGDRPALIYSRLDANGDRCMTVEEFTAHLLFRRLEPSVSP